MDFCLPSISLVRPDTRTGRLLDENYILQCNIPQSAALKMETYFDDLESAIAYISTSKNLHINVEFHVYANDKHVYMDTSETDNAMNLFATPNFQRGRK